VRLEPASVYEQAEAVVCPAQRTCVLIAVLLLLSGFAGAVSSGAVHSATSVFDRRSPIGDVARGNSVYLLDPTRC